FRKRHARGSQRIGSVKLELYISERKTRETLRDSKCLWQPFPASHDRREGSRWIARSWKHSVCNFLCKPDLTGASRKMDFEQHSWDATTDASSKRTTAERQRKRRHSHDAGTYGSA